MASLAEQRVIELEDMPTEPEAQARPEELRLLEALLFASAEPLDQAALAKRMPEGVDIKAALLQLQADYAPRGVNLVRVSNKWSFRTAGDLAWMMTRESTETRKLSRAAIEMLAIIAYHQPVTRAEIEEIRGVVTSKGTLDVLLETGWVKPRGRRKTPGRPLTFGTTDAFLAQFSLESLNDLPGLEELKGTGLLDSRLPTGFSVPVPSDDPALREDEDPLEPGDLDLALVPVPDAEPEAAETGEATEAAVQDAAPSETAAEAEAEAGAVVETVVETYVEVEAVVEVTEEVEAVSSETVALEETMASETVSDEAPEDDAESAPETTAEDGEPSGQ